MKIILFSRAQIDHSATELQQLFDAVTAARFDWAVNREFKEVVERRIGVTIPEEQVYDDTVGEQSKDTIMVCYGGDGTLLEGVQRLGGEPLPVIGINAGHLGFLTSAPVSGLDDIFKKIAAAEIRTERRSMLSIGGDLPSDLATRLALNEFTVQRNGAGMISVETYVDDQMVATYRGDGVIVSTPTGSTAYSLSAGGPVVAPTCACLVLSPLAPHNLTMRPVVIPDTATIRLKIEADHADAFITLDSRAYPIARHAEITLKKAAQSVFLATPHNISFYDTLRNKMMWGVDIRANK